jgi:hypothetical protein
MVSIGHRDNLVARDRSSKLLGKVGQAAASFEVCNYATRLGQLHVDLSVMDVDEPEQMGEHTVKHPPVSSSRADR